MLVSTKVKRKALDKSSLHLQVKINGTELEVVSKIKYLGVLLDNSLDWKDQVQAVSLKVSRVLGILKHAKIFLPFSALTSLYTFKLSLLSWPLPLIPPFYWPCPLKIRFPSHLFKTPN